MNDIKIRISLIIALTMLLSLYIIYRLKEDVGPHPNDKILRVFNFSPSSGEESDFGGKLNKNGKILKCFILASTHGNEEAGFRACVRLIANGWFAKKARENNINIIVIPAGNPYGLRNGVRWSANKSKPDINRNFGTETGDDEISAQIIRALADCDIVLDFHEGWGYYKQGMGSVGSTLMSTETPLGLAKRLNFMARNELNSSIVEPVKKFTSITGKQCDIKKTLRCYMQERQKEYILIETSGQNDIQPLEVRMRQVYTVLRVVLDHFKTV